MGSIHDWLVALSIVSVAIPAWVAVWEYRLKVKGEQRLQESATSEIDTRISKLFAELMWLAHGRGGNLLSDKAVEGLFEKGLVTKKDFGNVDQLQAKLQACVVILPVGTASQDAAIASIGVLGRRYEILREPARAALNCLRSFKQEQADKALMLLDE